MASSPDATGYTYINTGAVPVSQDEGVGFTYQNIGSFSVASWIGAVHGMVAPRKVAFGHTYVYVTV